MTGGGIDRKPKEEFLFGREVFDMPIKTRRRLKPWQRVWRDLLVALAIKPRRKRVYGTRQPWPLGAFDDQVHG